MKAAATKKLPEPAQPKRWFTSLLFKCLAGILSVSCIGIMVVLFSLALRAKSQLDDELRPHNLLLSIEKGLNDQGAKLLPKTAGAPECQSLLHSLLPEIFSESPYFWRKYNRSLVFGEETPLLVRYRLADGTSCQIPENRKDRLFDAVLEKEKEALPASPAMLWNEGITNAWQSIVSLAPEKRPGTILTVGVQMDNRLIYTVFPELKALGWTLVYLFVTSLLSAILIVLFVVYRIRKAEQAAAAWAQGDLSVRINDRHRDEFGHLTHTFDQMADALEKQMEISQSLAVAEERNRLARDLHDTVKQRCFALGLQLSVLSHQCREDAEQASQVKAALDLTSLMQKDLSDVIYRFSGPTIAQSGLKQAIADTLELLFHGSVLDWFLDVDDAGFALLQSDQALAAQLFLMTNEAAVNTLKHSDASQLVISFRQEAGRGVWSISDNGKGFDTGRAYGRGIGLANLMHRARSLSQGMLVIESAPGKGTVLTISFEMKGKISDDKHIAGR